MTYNPWRWKMLFILWWHYAGYRCSFGPPAIVVFVEGAFVSEYHTKLVGGCYRNRVAITSLLVNNDAGSGNNDEINTKPSSGKFKIFHKIAFRHMSFDQRTIRETLVQAPRQKYRIRKPHELEDYFADTEYRFRKDNGAIDYDTLLNSLDVRGDTQVIGSPCNQTISTRWPSCYISVNVRGDDPMIMRKWHWLSRGWNARLCLGRDGLCVTSFESHRIV